MEDERLLPGFLYKEGYKNSNEYVGGFSNGVVPRGSRGSALGGKPVALDPLLWPRSSSGTCHPMEVMYADK